MKPHREAEGDEANRSAPRTAETDRKVGQGALGATSAASAKRPLPPAARHRGGTIRTTRVIAFLGQLQRFLRGKLLIIWDRAQIHRSLRLRRSMERQRERLAMAYLPGYAPELNPVEYLWAYWKKNELANFCPKDIWQLGHFASQALKRIRRRPNRPALVTSFWKQAELF